MVKKDVVHSGILPCHEKRGHSVIFNMDLEHTKWEKPDRERQVLYEYYLYVESKKIKCTKIRVKLLSSGDRKDGEGIRLIVFKCTN